MLQVGYRWVTLQVRATGGASDIIVTSGLQVAYFLHIFYIFSTYFLHIFYIFSTYFLHVFCLFSKCFLPISCSTCYSRKKLSFPPIPLSQVPQRSDDACS